MFIGEKDETEKEKEEKGGEERRSETWNTLSPPTLFFSLQLFLFSLSFSSHSSSNVRLRCIPSLARLDDGPGLRDIADLQISPRRSFQTD